MTEKDTSRTLRGPVTETRHRQRERARRLVNYVRDELQARAHRPGITRGSSPRSTAT